ncbi:DUF4836 family protein [Rurimicrobium arvi]|uniref:DUF4836 family protein n=1 Tax=Rurimicrobium arvi TaxID=2049916 RepID=A0ABP8MKW0_9BACT
MNIRLRLLCLLLAFIVVASGCHSTPEHAKYIPKNALMVAEINTKELSKKIAWSMITNNSLWEKLRGKKNKADSIRQSEFIKNMQEAGVDELNTFYAYLNNNGSNTQEACFIALVPLKDAMKWESFIKKSFPGTIIKDNDKRKEAKLDEHIYAGWTNSLMILVSLQETGSFIPDDGSAPQTTDNETRMAAYLESAFSVSSDNSLLSDKRFAQFEKHKHDLGFWVNIDAVMSNYGAKNLGAVTGGISLSNNMWRNSAFSAATNFEKGRVLTEMMMYSSDEFKELNKQYSNKDVDEDLVKRIPKENLDYVFGYHMSPEGTLKTIEKMGMLGMANGFLKEQNLSVEEILSAISGDMVFSMNNYRQTKETILFDSTDASSAFNSYKTDMDFLFALKINNKQAFEKIVNLAVAMQLIESAGADVYKLKSGTSDSAAIVIRNGYASFSNKSRVAQSFADGQYSSQPSLKIKEYVLKHPFGMFFDFSSWAKRSEGMLAATKPDSMVYAASIKTFDNIVFNGGKLEGDGFKYQMSINLVNKNESSILQLLDFGKAMQEAQVIRDEEARILMQEVRQRQEAMEAELAE